MDLLLIDSYVNRLPGSVNLQTSLFSVHYAGGLLTPDPMRFYGTGNLVDGAWPEVMMTNYGGWNADHTAAAPSPLVLLAIRPEGAVLLDSQAVLGEGTTLGTTNPLIVDLNNDGLGDFVYIGYNEAPWGSMPSRVFIQRPDGSFAASSLGGPSGSSHNWNLGDFNGDGFVDIVASLGTFMEDRIYQGLPDWGPWIGPTLYLNNQDGTFRVVTPIRARTPAGDMQMGSGAAAAMGDFDHDGKTDIVVTDTGQNIPGPGDHNYSWILNHIEFRSDGSAVGDLNLLPVPYFDRDTRYQYLVPQRTDTSHDIKVVVLDVNNDGWDDIVVSSIVWGGSPEYTHGGVLQILLNQHGEGFTDVTDTNLFNFYLGAGTGHQLRFMDVNGDGFVDIIVSEGPTLYGGNGDGSSTLPEMASNRILINSGTGKFVEVFREGFHQATLMQVGVVPDSHLGIADFIVAPYMTPDGRFGYINQAWVTNTITNENVLGFFDFRVDVPLSTGPNGSDPAMLGAPGFSEYFYLTEYADVAAAVTAGTFANGLEHYLQVGKAAGRFGFAPNAAIHGSSSADVLEGREGNETLRADAGNDHLAGHAGNDSLDGGSGRDAALFAGPLGAYSVAFNPVTHTGTVADSVTSRDGTDQLHDIERAAFADLSLAFDLDGVAGQAAKCIGAVFGRSLVYAPSVAGIGIGLLDGGMSYESLMALALENRFEPGATNAQIVQVLFTNVVGVAPTADQLANFVAYLDQHILTPAGLAVLAADSTFNEASIGLSGLAATGLQYIPWG